MGGKIESLLSSDIAIRVKLIGVVVACVLVPILLISAILVSSIRQASLAEFEDRSRAEIAHIERLFTQYLQGMRDDAVFLARSTALSKLDRSVTTYFDSTPHKMDPAQVGDAEREVFELFERFGSHRADLAYVYLGLDHGGYIQWPAYEMNNYDPRPRPWYTSAIDSNEPVLSPPYLEVNTGKPVIDYVVRFETATGVRGVVGVDVFLSKLTELVHSMHFGDSGYLLLLDGMGNVLADPSMPENNFMNIQELEAVYPNIDALPGGFSSYPINGQDWFVQVLDSTSLGWKFIGLVPRENVYVQANRLVTVVSGVSLVLGVLFGVLGFSVIARAQRARDANPLTGLPGNLQIDATTNRWLGEGQDFRVAYFDLNNFKPFNDYYGYNNGDRVIVALADIIKDCAGRDGNFIGHIGGDDFVVLFKGESWREICHTIVSRFDIEVMEFYPHEDLANGGITTFDREGKKQFFSLLGLAVGVAHPDSAYVKSHHEVSALASSAKSEAKKAGRSNVFASRRRTLQKASECKVAQFPRRVDVA